MPHQPSLGRGESRTDVGLSAPCKAIIQFLFCPTQHGRLYRYKALARAVILLTDRGTSPFSPSPCPPFQRHLPAAAQPDSTMTQTCHPPLLSPITVPLDWNISYFSTLDIFFLANSFSHRRSYLRLYFFQKSSLTPILNKGAYVPHMPCTTPVVALTTPCCHCLCAKL